MDPVIIAALITLGLLGLLFGGGLAFASKKFAVEKDPRIDDLNQALPGANCGGCGFAGCSAFAEALLAGNAKPSACTAGGPDTAAAVAKILGVELEDITPMVAVVQCQGGQGIAIDRFRVHGIQSCAIAHRTSGGHKACQYGCLGFGDCMRVCPFDAINMDETACRWWTRTMHRLRSLRARLPALDHEADPDRASRSMSAAPPRTRAKRSRMSARSAASAVRSAPRSPPAARSQ